MNTNSRRLRVKLTQLYIDMRLKRMSRLEWMTASEEIVHALLEENDVDISAQLFFAQLCIMRQDSESVEDLLDQCSVWLLDYCDRFPVCHAYYLYLTSLMQEDDEYDQKVIDKLLELSVRYPSKWQISWFYYYLNKENMADAAEQYHYLKGMFIRGCRSPLMYLEARTLIERNPTFVYEASEFEEQLLLFMLRHTGISISLARTASDYLATLRFYRPLYLPILKGMYEVAPGNVLLEAICRQGILGGHRERGMSAWYRRGIDQGFHLNGLYEAYLASLPVERWKMDGEELSAERAIPMQVLQYFAHTPQPEEVRCAYLYALVHKYRARWLSLYKEYEPLIQPFMMDQFRQGRVNAGLCYLYTNFLVSPMLSSSQGELLADICYSCRVTGLTLADGTAIVEYEDYLQEISAPVVDGTTILPLFGTRFSLWEQDDFGRRYPCPEAGVEPMMDRHGWSAWLNDHASEYGLYQLAVIEEAQDEELVGLLPGILHIFADPLVTDTYKREFADRLVPLLDQANRTEEIDRIMEEVFQTGAEGNDEELAFWQKLYEEERIGVYGMRFLMQYLDVDLSQKGILFTRAQALSADTSAFAGSLLEQMTQEQYLLPNAQQILEAYQEEDTSLLVSYLEFACGQCFLEKKELDSKQFSLITKLAGQGTVFFTIVRLSFLECILKDGLGRQKPETLDLASAYLQEFYHNGVYFSWFQSFHTLLEALREKESCQVIEYRGLQYGPVWIRCSVNGFESQENEEMEDLPMEKVCEGVYTRQFLLFWGERLSYEICTLDADGTEEVILKQGVEQCGAALDEGGSRYSRINEMLYEREMRDNQKLYKELEDYFKMDAMTALFSPK
ncbi:MAG: DUF5717 family protein [Lachnospiraceae bacterium]|nr:DUF5717 family protein [Lachnospiraceae bacterium]